MGWYNVKVNNIYVPVFAPDRSIAKRMVNDAIEHPQCLKERKHINPFLLEQPLRFMSNTASGKRSALLLSDEYV